MTITKGVDSVRLIIGDRDVSNPHFSDDEIQYFLDNRAGNDTFAAADCLDSMAAEFAAGIDFTTDTLAIKKLQRSDAMAKRADDLRAYAEGIGQVDTVKIDGYSQDIDNTDTSLITAGNVDVEIPRYGPSWSTDAARQQGYIPGES